MNTKSETKSEAWIINYLSKREFPEKSIYYKAISNAYDQGNIKDEAQVVEVKKIFAKAKVNLEERKEAPPVKEILTLEIKKPVESKIENGHVLDFLNEPLRFDPNDSTTQKIKKSRKFVPEDFKAARCLDLRKAVATKDTEAVLQECSDVIPYLRQPCDFKKNWEAVLDSYYKHSITYSLSEDEAIRTLEDYMEDNNLEAHRDGVKNKD